MGSPTLKTRISLGDFLKPVPFLTSLFILSSFGYALYTFITAYREFRDFNRLGHYFSKDPAGITAGSCIVIIIAVVLLTLAFRHLRNKRLIEDIPTSRVRSIAMGLTELKGKARSDTPLKSPLSKCSCVYYIYTTEVLVRTRNGTRWKQIRRINSGVPFYIEDDTGRVLVSPDRLLMDFEPRYTDYDSSRSKRYREWFILDHEPVYIIGTAMKTRNFMQEFRVRLAEEIRRLKNDRERLMQYDENNDGVIDAMEWDNARSRVEQELREKEIAKKHDDPLADVTLGKGIFEDIFIISEKSEKHLIKRLFWKGTGFLFLSFVIYVAVMMIMFSSINSLREMIY